MKEMFVIGQMIAYPGNYNWLPVHAKQSALVYTANRLYTIILLYQYIDMNSTREWIVGILLVSV